MSKEERYYQTGKDTILYQTALVREFSDRAVNLLNLGIATLVAGVIGVSPNIESWEWNYGTTIAIIVWIAGFLLLISYCLATTQTRSWHGFPSMAEMAQMIDDPMYNEEDMLWSQGEYFREAAQHNDAILDGKAKAIRWALVGLSVEIVSTITIVMFVLLEKLQSPGSAGAILVG